MTHRPDIHMRLRPLKLRLTHRYPVSVLVELGLRRLWSGRGDHSPRTRLTISAEIAGGTSLYFSNCMV
jgi:hypothetical protein